MPTKKKTEIINWETKINKTHEILSKTIFELLFDSFCAGDLSEKELTLAKAFVTYFLDLFVSLLAGMLEMLLLTDDSNFFSSKALITLTLLLEKIHKIEVEFHKQDK